MSSKMREQCLAKTPPQPLPTRGRGSSAAPSLFNLKLAADTGVEMGVLGGRQPPKPLPLVGRGWGGVFLANTGMEA